MAKIVTNGARLNCSFGQAPSMLKTTPIPGLSNVTVGGKAVATNRDKIPNVNIPPFGLCTTPTNPAVAAAQGAPAPCIPVITSPWFPTSMAVSVNGTKALTESSCTMCAYGGRISIANGDFVEIN